MPQEYAYLLLVVIPILATIKVLIQGMASKKGVNQLKDVLVFTGIMFLAISIFVTIVFFKYKPSLETIIFAVIAGILNVVFQVCYIQAFSIGPVSISGTIANFAMVLPLLYGFIWLNEAVTVFKVVGILFTCVAFILLTKKESGKTVSLKWYIYIFTAFFSVGIVSIVQSSFKTLESSYQRNEFLAINYLVAAISCFVLAYIVKKDKKENNVKWTYKYLFPVILGVVLGIYQVISMYTLSIVDVSIYYPITSALALIFLFVVGVLVFKDKPTKSQIIGILIGIISVILVNL